MEREKRKEMQSQYANRHPEMGVVCWQSGARLWLAASKDTHADHNSTLFQLKLGSWPNREMQQAYHDDPASFAWSVLKVLDYENADDNHSDDLELLLMLCLEEHPGAALMRPTKKK